MRISLKLAAGLAALTLIASCGGSDDDEAPDSPGQFEAVVSFGDSLSDVGTYAPATSATGNGQPPYFGGKFTTNASTSQIWVERVATALDLVVTPAQVGFGASSVDCPAAADAALAGTCTAYGQGGSRVTDPQGIGKDGGALTVPMVDQVARHLARFGRFTDRDLIFVYGGNNDAFVQFGVYSATAAQVQAQLQGGAITNVQAEAALADARTRARAAMTQAADELGALVEDEILAKGGRYVAVMNLPDSTLTPFGQTLSAGTLRPVLADLVDTFNDALEDALRNAPVRLIDAKAASEDAYDNPGDYGFVNVSVPACDADKIAAVTGGQVTDGSSLFCDVTPGAPTNGLRTGANADTWLFADGVHPSRGGHAAFADAVLDRLDELGWID
jgi:outer membrane lipase/esterase